MHNIADSDSVAKNTCYFDHVHVDRPLRLPSLLLIGLLWLDDDNGDNYGHISEIIVIKAVIQYWYNCLGKHNNDCRDNGYDDDIDDDDDGWWWWLMIMMMNDNNLMIIITTMILILMLLLLLMPLLLLIMIIMIIIKTDNPNDHNIIIMKKTKNGRR